MAVVKFSDEMLGEAVPNCTSYLGVARYIGASTRSGSAAGHLKCRIQALGLDTSHFLGLHHNRGKSPVNRFTPADILRIQDRNKPKMKSKHLRWALLETGVPYVCAIDGQLPEWNGKVLLLQVDHINGDSMDHRQENLRFLCPNCHTQTDTFGYRGPAPIG